MKTAIYRALFLTVNHAKPTTSVSSAAMEWFQVVIALPVYIVMLLDALLANNRTIALSAHLSLS